MSKAKQETIADIVAQLRAAAHIQNADSPRDVLKFADRIEAAAKREREAGAEAAQICGEIGELIGSDADRNETVTDCNHFGNAAKMREALEKAQNVLHCAIVAGILKGEDAVGALNAVSAAISTPSRNCDVGTPEEQYERVRAFCKRHKVGLRCVGCPVNGVLPKNCALIWAQMPYEEGGANGK